MGGKKVVVVLIIILIGLISIVKCFGGSIDQDIYNELRDQFIVAQKACVNISENGERIIDDHEVILYLYKKYKKELEVDDQYIINVNNFINDIKLYDKDVEEEYRNLFYAVSEIDLGEENREQCDELIELLKKTVQRWEQHNIEFKNKMESGAEYRKGLIEYLKEIDCWDKEDNDFINSKSDDDSNENINA